MARTSLELRALVLGAAAVMAACSSQAVSPIGGSPCPALALLGPQMLYPIPGATGVPTAAGMIVVAGSLQANDVVELTPAGGMTLDLGPLGPAPSPLPSPAATPAQAGASPSAVSYPALQSATTYTVSYRDTSKHCPLAIGGGGSFETQ